MGCQAKSTARAILAPITKQDRVRMNRAPSAETASHTYPSELPCCDPPGSRMVWTSFPLAHLPGRMSRNAFHHCRRSSGSLPDRQKPMWLRAEKPRGATKHFFHSGSLSPRGPARRCAVAPGALLALECAACEFTGCGSPCAVSCSCARATRASRTAAQSLAQQEALRCLNAIAAIAMPSSTPVPLPPVALSAIEFAACEFAGFSSRELLLRTRYARVTHCRIVPRSRKHCVV